MLKLFLYHHDQVVTYQTIIDHLWGAAYPVSYAMRNMRVWISSDLSPAQHCTTYTL